MSAYGQRRSSIIFFLHIPFPTSQIFRALYCGEEILNVRSPAARLLLSPAGPPTDSLSLGLHPF